MTETGGLRREEKNPLRRFAMKKVPAPRRGLENVGSREDELRVTRGWNREGSKEETRDGPKMRQRKKKKESSRK